MSPAASPPPVPAAPPASRLLRGYLRLAEPLYRRMNPADAAWAREVDAWLYGTRTGQRVLVALLLGLAATAALLARYDMPWWLAIPAALMLWVALLSTVARPWLRPEHFAGRRLLQGVLKTVVFAVAGLLLGFFVAHLLRPDGWDLERFVADLPLLARSGVLVTLAAAGAAVLLLQWAVAQWRRHRVQQELLQLRLAHERDQAALQAREAELRLLQAQIQPHFVFNTLAALQHWVDTGDARAPGLLRTLTAFLRQGSELLGREQVALGEELALAARYLEIVQHRLGERLHARVEVPAALQARALPPGLLLTLVENAVKHGVERSLQPVTVAIEARPAAGGGLEIEVRDDGPGWGGGTPPAGGLGLANLRARLQRAFGPGARLELAPAAPEGRGCRAVMHLPAGDDR